MRKKKSQEVDVCFVLEGTYPFISGGVSTWVHQAISTMPDLTFAIHYIGAQSKAIGESKYEIPENVRVIEKVFIFDDEHRGAVANSRVSPRLETKLRNALESLLELFATNDHFDVSTFAGITGEFQQIAAEMTFDQFWKHPATWDCFHKFYEQLYPGESFATSFWNTKFIIKPVWELLRSFSRLPKAKVYHSVSTGYAGFLAAVAKQQTGRPFLLSEHGIYVRERIADLLNEEWAPSLSSDFVRPPAGVSVLRQAWIEFFIYLGRFCYESADHITSLFERNAQFQVEFGADRSKIEIIPNGIKPARFESIEASRIKLKRKHPKRKTVGFLGRVVSIKDVRTLIRAARITSDSVPDAEFLLVGPTDEDPSYFESCKKLISDLDLDSNVKLTGPKKLDEALPLFDVMVLSSVSEGLPFAILESFAAGIPVVSTDVGACSELIYGFTGEGEAPGGIVVPVADAAALAEAITTVITDPQLQSKFGQQGKNRVYRSYQEQDVMSRFRDHYLNLDKREQLSEV